MFRTPHRDYWNENWAGVTPIGSISSLNVFNFDLKALFRALKLNGEAHVAEIGFAPGKTIAWIHDNITRNVLGVDYSDRGCAVAREFFRRTGRSIRVMCEDAASVVGLDSQMDLVYSIGVLEHFSDPSDLVATHLRWINDNGTALILIPNYSGLYIDVQSRLDPANLERHNLELMTLDFWRNMQSRFPDFMFSVGFYGHPSPWMLSLQKYGIAGRALQYALNFAAFLMPSNTRLSANILIAGRRRT
jgi:SAM-dependent methyltransferase